MENYRQYLLKDEEADAVLLALNDLQTIITNVPEAENLSTLDYDTIDELATMLYQERQQAKTV